jgi:hypothetical protein
MTEISESKYLLYLEKHLADQNPVLLQASKVFHELDQITYDLGLLDKGESTASKISWWPIITVLGTPTSGSTEFINKVLKSEILSTTPGVGSSKFTIINYGNSEHSVALPGTALDGDTRLPFYQISEKIERVKKGEGSRINSYMEIKTANSDLLNGKIIVNAPSFQADGNDEVVSFLTQHIIEMSDLVLIFFDASKPDLESLRETLTKFFTETVNTQDPNKFIFVVNQTGAAAGLIDLTLWKKQLADFGLESSQFVTLQRQTAPVQEEAPVGFMSQKKVVSKPVAVEDPGIKKIEHRIANIKIESAYRILSSLEQSISEIDDVVIPEVQKAISVWKERSQFTSGLILSFILFVLIFIEMQVGIFMDLLFDPVTGPILILVLMLIMLPIHIISSKLHAKFIVKELEKRQKELGLMENMANLFEKSLTFWRILFPIKAPVGWDKQTRNKLLKLVEQPKQFVQTLNDNFSSTMAQSSALGVEQEGD